MKKHVSTILLVLVFFIGCSLMLYPIVSDWWNSKVQTRAVTEYSDAVDTMDAQTCEEILAQAESYNTSLAVLDYPLSGYGVLSTEYTQALNLPNTDVMGYITIDKLNVKLPIYHGTSDSALAAGVGHLEGSSLPVGGASTHAVLSAHRGLPTSRLFTDLDKMEEGDTFSITVLNRTLTYQVDQILIVEPQDVAALQIVPGEDLCTLLTCTPYGINTHRLLVRGHRVDTPVAKNITIPNEATRLDSLLLAPVIAVPMLLVLLVYLLIRYRRRKPVGVPMPERANKGEGMRAQGTAAADSGDARQRTAAAKASETEQDHPVATAKDTAQHPTAAKSGETDWGRPAAASDDAARHPASLSAADAPQTDVTAKYVDASQLAAKINSEDASRPSVSADRKDDSQLSASASRKKTQRSHPPASGDDASQRPVTSGTDNAPQASAAAAPVSASPLLATASSKGALRSSTNADSEDASSAEGPNDVAPLLAVPSTLDSAGAHLHAAVTPEAVMAFLAADIDEHDDALPSSEEDDFEDDDEDEYVGAHFAKPAADRIRRDDRRGR